MEVEEQKLCNILKSDCNYSIRGFGANFALRRICPYFQRRQSNSPVLGKNGGTPIDCTVLCLLCCNIIFATEEVELGYKVSAVNMLLNSMA